MSRVTHSEPGLPMMITDRIGLHLVLLPSLTSHLISEFTDTLINLGIVKVLIIWIMPKIDKFLHFHKCIDILMDFKVCRKFR